MCRCREGKRDSGGVTQHEESRVFVPGMGGTINVKSVVII